MSAGPARGTASRAARVVELVVVVVVLAVAALAFVVRFDRPERHTTGDTYFYALEAERDAGVPSGQATNDAKRLLCSDIRLGLHLDGARAPSCGEYVAITAPRYVEIFTSRPLWPLLLAPAVALVGLTRAIIWMSMLGALLGALAVFLALRGLGHSVPAAGAAGVAFSLLPTGYWSDQLLPEGAVLVVLVVAIYGACQAVRSRWWGRRCWCRRWSVSTRSSRPTARHSPAASSSRVCSSSRCPGARAGCPRCTWRASGSSVSPGGS